MARHPAPTATVDRQTFTIGVLSLSACVLLVGWLLLALTPPPAHAIGQSDRGGDYVVLTQQISTSQEALVLVDAASKRMVVYAFDFNNKNLVLLDGFDLGGLRGAQANEDDADRGNRRGERRKP
jgi:hypothetical protein